jgi:hypothetical protein
MRKQGMSQCQVPYRRDQIDPGAVATAVEGVAAAVEIVVVAAVAAADEAVDYGGAGAVVTATPEQGMSQTWDWGWERGGSWGNAGWVVVVESRNRGQQHGTLRSARREHEGPEG